MSLLRRLKLTALSAAERVGLFARVGSSAWRRDRLLILCYHGVSLSDEHEWSEAHLSESRLARRLEMLREDGCSVLPLNDAVERLARNDLPPRSVVVTFDEGMFDFYAKAYPLLRAYEIPATVYVPTYYMTCRAPIFDLACSYLLWRGRGQQVDTGFLLPERQRVRIPTETAARDSLHLAMRAHVNAVGYSAARKDEMLGDLCRQIGSDWDAFLASRTLQLMTPKELASLDRSLIDVQLHTHRHRTPRQHALFVRELHDNIAALEAIGFSRDDLRHFCYPSGDADPRFYAWLNDLGIKSATTCEPKYATRTTNPFELPRLVDTMGVTETQFRAWTSGVAALVPRRRYEAAAGADIGLRPALGGETDGVAAANYARPRGAAISDREAPISLVLQHDRPSPRAAAESLGVRRLEPRRADPLA